jgi:hypothetical protein
MTNSRTIPSGIQGQTPDLEQAKTERDSRLQQLGPEDLQRQWQRNLDKAKMSGKVVFPAAEILRQVRRLRRSKFEALVTRSVTNR